MRAHRPTTRPPGREPIAVNERQHSGEIVARPGSALRVVRPRALYRRRSRRCSLHQRCHASSASSAQEPRADVRPPWPSPPRRQACLRHPACAHAWEGLPEHRLHGAAEQTGAAPEACLLITTGVSAASGQTVSATTGALNGKVSDMTGATLPGVTVGISGPAMQGTRTDLTDADGAHRFSAIPPVDFTVMFKLSGFEIIRSTTHAPDQPVERPQSLHWTVDLTA